MTAPSAAGVIIGSPGTVQPELFDTDTGAGGYTPRYSFGSTGFFTIRANAASGLTTGATTNSADFVAPPWARGLTLFVDVNAVTGATSGNAFLTVELQPKDPLSGNYVSPALSSGGLMFPSSSGLMAGTTGTYALQVYPGASLSTGRTYPYSLPGTYRVQSVASGSSFNMSWQISAIYEP